MQPIEQLAAGLSYIGDGAPVLSRDQLRQLRKARRQLGQTPATPIVPRKTRLAAELAMARPSIDPRVLEAARSVLIGP